MRWFEIALVVLTAFTGLVWLLDKLYLAKRRAATEGLLDDGKEPIVIDYSKAFFPVLLVVLVLRSFIASCKRSGIEPFAWFRDVLSRIPEHSITRLGELLPHTWKPAISPSQA